MTFCRQQGKRGDPDPRERDIGEGGEGGGELGGRTGFFTLFGGVFLILVFLVCFPSLFLSGQSMQERRDLYIFVRI